MQDEVVKHSRKILRIFKKPGQTFMKKLQEVAIEIFVIVFAVTFSIWLHGLKEHSREQKEVRVFLKNIRQDLSKDIEWMRTDKETFQGEINKFKIILSLTPDSLKKQNTDVGFPMRLFMNRINSGNYEGFKTSGKIGYIENEDLKRMILGFYQQDALLILEINDTYNQNLVKTLDFLLLATDNQEDESILKPNVQSKIAFMIMIGENIVRSYDKAIIKHAEEVVKKIDEEIGQ
jgi:hypothetical protein